VPGPPSDAACWNAEGGRPPVGLTQPHTARDNVLGLRTRCDTLRAQSERSARDNVLGPRTR